MKNALITTAIFLLTATFAGCGGGGGGGISGTPTPTPTLTSIAVTPGGPSIAPTTIQQFTAWGTYSDNTRVNLTTSATWSSSDPAIALINAHGLATAGTTTGSTVITALYSAITGSAVLTTSPVSLLAITPFSPPGIAPGMTLQFTALGTLANGTVQNLTSGATWTSSDVNIATVSGSGLATAGTTTGAATVSADFSGITGTASLTTSAVATISTSPTMTSIANGTSKQFTASGTLVDGAVHDLTTWATWTSSVPGVAMVSNTAGSKGLVTSLATGTTLITASFDSVVSSPASTLIVTQATLVSLATAPSSTSIVLGTAQQFTSTGTFTDGTTQDITSSATWTSSNPTVAVISNATGSRGIATSQAVGTATISSSLSGITSNNATLTITPAELVSIDVTPHTASVAILQNATVQFTALGTYTDGTVKDLTKLATWASSDTNVVTMSVVAGFEGVAIPSLINVGTAQITAIYTGITSNAASFTVRSF